MIRPACWPRLVAKQARSGWWWRKVIELEGRHQRQAQEPPSEPHERMRILEAEHEAVFDWPGLHALTAWPDLRMAAQVSGHDALRFHHAGTPPPRVNGVPTPIAVDLKPIAEELIGQYSLSPDGLRAGIIVLAVQGDWSHIAAPGVLVCSMATAQDGERISPLIEAAFRSGLTT